MQYLHELAYPPWPRDKPEWVKHGGRHLTLNPQGEPRMSDPVPQASAWQPQPGFAQPLRHELACRLGPRTSAAVPAEAGSALRTMAQDLGARMDLRRPVAGNPRARAEVRELSRCRVDPVGTMSLGPL